LQENSAKLFLDENKSNQSEFLDLVKIINEKIYKKDQNVVYYSGGLRALSSLCINDCKFLKLFLKFSFFYQNNYNHFSNKKNTF